MSIKGIKMERFTGLFYKYIKIKIKKIKKKERKRKDLFGFGTKS